MFVAFSFVMSDCRCQEKVNLLTEHIEKLNNETKQLKAEYNQLLIENLQKDVIIRNLKKKLERNKYGDFKGVFSKLCLDKLQSIGNSQIWKLPFGSRDMTMMDFVH